MKNTFNKSGYTFPISPRSLSSPSYYISSLTSNRILNFSQSNLTNFGMLMILLLISRRYLSMLSTLSKSCTLANQPSKCPLVSTNLVELTICFTLFFGLLEEAAMATVFRDGFWSSFRMGLKLMQNECTMNAI